MNLKFLVILFFSVLCISFVYASPVDITFEKNFYYLGETVQGKLYLDDSVNDKIKTTDFHLSFNGTNTNVYPTLNSFENYTYFYFDIPYGLIEGNYDFVLEDVLYLKDEILVEEDQLFDLNINSRNGSIVSISPAIIEIDMTKDNTFYIDFENPSYVDTNVNISVEDGFIAPSNNYFSLNSGKSKEIKFNLYIMFVDKDETSIIVSYDDLSYVIPVYIDGFSEETVNETEVEEEMEGKLSFLEEEFNVTIDINQSVSGFVKIFNDLSEDLSNVEIKVSEGLKEIISLEFETIDSIKIGETIKNHIYINENGIISSGNYEGTIDLIVNEEIYDSVVIKVEVLESEEVEEIEEEKEKPDVEPEGDNRNTIIITILIIILIILIAIFVKYKISKKKPTGFPLKR
jgi:hypothetical protein